MNDTTTTKQILLTRRSPAYWRVTINHRRSIFLDRTLFHSSMRPSPQWKLTST